jgi:hypothetical protein
MYHHIMVDDADYDWLSEYHWTWRNGYACVRMSGRYIGMHRLIMGVYYREPVIIDHIDRNHKNNQRSNLRRADRCQNQQNRKTNKGNTLPKGIRKLPSGRYNVRIQTYNSRQIIGTFNTLEEAITERNRVAKHQHGEFFSPSHLV